MAMHWFLVLFVSALGVTARAQAPAWQVGRFDLGNQTTAAARLYGGAFQANFYCEPSADTPANLTLSITALGALDADWTQAHNAGHFDRRALVRADTQVVGDTSATARADGRQLRLGFDPKNYAFDRLVSGANLTLEFENGAGLAAFTLPMPGAGLGAALCPVAKSCGHDTTNLCAIFATVETATTAAIPLTPDKNEGGDPQWFTSEYQTPFTTLPFHRTASIFDPDRGVEMHLSCLSEQSEALAINFLFDRDHPDIQVFDTGSPDLAEIVWETAETAGRWTQFQVYDDGYALGREGIAVDMINRATLEELMTTDRHIEVIARQGPRQVAAQFTPRGSRNAICAVMNGCGVPLGFSPACRNRN